jgi:hypothetical protein
MNATDDELEALARIIWEASGEFSTPGRGRATEWGDVRVSAARQAARYIAEAVHAAGFHRQGPFADEWEYGVTTKWGTTGPRSLAGAQEYAALICAEIESGQSSGDLSHHGQLRRRRPATQPGQWEPIEAERNAS